jgi:AraC family transcriptional regulator
MMRGLRLRYFERLLFASDTLAVATHRLPADDPEFEGHGPASGFFIVFPRNTTLLEFAGGERVVGSPAVATLYNRGQGYRRWRISAEGDHCDWVAIAPDTLREVVARFDRQAAESERPLAFTHVPVEASDYLEQRAVVDHLSTATAPDALFVEETMLGVVARILARAHDHRATPTPRRQQELARAAAAIVGSTFTQNVSLPRLAGALGTSPFHLARSFKRVTGRTLHQHRLLLRLNASLASLHDTQRDLTTIALDLGFADHSHFTAAFRQRFGTTPSAWRRRARSS